MVRVVWTTRTIVTTIGSRSAPRRPSSLPVHPAAPVPIRSHGPMAGGASTLARPQGAGAAPSRSRPLCPSGIHFSFVPLCSPSLVSYLFYALSSLVCSSRLLSGSLPVAPCVIRDAMSA
eukprot:scaffold30212_cov35-Tisochrysis_lutea.AAC.3